MSDSDKKFLKRFATGRFFMNQIREVLASGMPVAEKLSALDKIDRLASSASIEAASRSTDSRKGNWCALQEAKFAMKAVAEEARKEYWALVRAQ